MDPTETLTQLLKRLFSATIDDDYESEDDIDLRMHLSDLNDWLEKGGFPPDVEQAVHNFQSYVNSWRKS